MRPLRVCKNLAFQDEGKLPGTMANLISIFLIANAMNTVVPLKKTEALGVTKPPLLTSPQPRRDIPPTESPLIEGASPHFSSSISTDSRPTAICRVCSMPAIHRETREVDKHVHVYSFPKFLYIITSGDP